MVKSLSLRSIIYIVLVVLWANSSIWSQAVPWFNPESQVAQMSAKHDHGDCAVTRKEVDKQLNIPIVEFQARALFMHTHPKFQKWIKNKFLMECSANVYHADKASFLQLHFKINSENAKHSYGKLEQGAKIKIMFSDGEYIYMENIERDRGTMKRSKKTTTYQGIFPIDKSDKKELKKREIEKIGIIWEEGYQEYEVQNVDLIKNQLNCLDK